MKGKAIKIVLAVILTTATLILGGLALALHNSTLIAWWKPFAICLLMALGCSLWLNKLIKYAFNLSNDIFNFIISLVFAFSAFIGLFYTINFYGSDKNSNQQQYVKVTHKFSEEHYRVKRVSRHAVAGDEKYRVYYMVIEFPDGQKKKISVPVGKYMKLQAGKEITISVEKGLFGFPVIKKYDLPLNKHKKINKRNKLQHNNLTKQKQT